MFTSGGLGLGLGLVISVLVLSCYFGLGFTNLVLFTSLFKMLTLIADINILMQTSTMNFAFYEICLADGKSKSSKRSGRESRLEAWNDQVVHIAGFSGELRRFVPWTSVATFQQCFDTVGWLGWGQGGHAACK